MKRGNLTDTILALIFCLMVVQMWVDYLRPEGQARKVLKAQVINIHHEYCDAE